MDNDDRSRGSEQPNRRQILLTAGSTVAAGVVAAYAPTRAASVAGVETPAADVAVAALEDAVPITLRINGKDHSLRIDPRTTLLDCLRETVALTGTKKGCDHGQCGACTVHVNGRRVLSCLNFAVMHDGEEITTIEGLGTPDAMHPMQAAFFTHDAYQCGYCTSLLAEFPRLSMKKQFQERLCSLVRQKPATSYDNFLRDISTRYVQGYTAPTFADLLEHAPFAE